MSIHIFEDYFGNKGSGIISRLDSSVELIKDFYLLYVFWKVFPSFR